ncbi:MAG: hypothetical protein QM610_04705 [Chitinophagaceae bacterium]
MATIINDFRVLKDNFPKILDLSGYKMEHLAERIGISAPVFSKKKKANNFGLDEMDKLMDIVWSDWLEDKFMSAAIGEGINSGHMTKEETEEMFAQWK